MKLPFWDVRCADKEKVMGFSKKSVLLSLSILIVFFLMGSTILPAKAGHAPEDTTGQLNSYNKIFFGWVDFDKNLWSLYGYSSMEDWSNVIDQLNNVLQASCKTQHLSKKSIKGAVKKDDKGYAGNDLYLEFSDVKIDYDNYHLYLAIDFIDAKTQKIVYSIPRTMYYGSAWGFENFLKAALEKVNETIAKTILTESVEMSAGRGQSTAGNVQSKDSVFIGWIDLHPENWALYDFRSQQDWEVMINRLNNYFQSQCGLKYLIDKEIKGAVSEKDTNFAGNKLYVKFSDVRFDDKKNSLYLAFEVIDGETQKSLIKIPQSGYKGKSLTTWGFENILKKSLEKVNIKLNKVIENLEG